MSEPKYSDAPGSPGITPTWTSSAKDMVGCSVGPSRLWFTAGFGILNEVYYPRVDIPQIRDLGFIVADGKGFWAEVKRVANYKMTLLAPGVPAIEFVHSHPRYSLRLRVSSDTRRDVLAVEAHLEGDPGLLLYALLAPHLGSTGRANRGGTALYRGRRVLWAEQGPFAVALAAVDAQQHDAILRSSAGYVGFSDGWQDFAKNGAMTWTWPAAGPGNIALMAELPRRAVIALGLGSSREAAATLAISALLQPFDNLLQQHIAQWETWHARRSERASLPLDTPSELHDEFLVSCAVLRAHLDKTYPGAMVASLSVPWGDSGEERGGYHLAWPRDMVECAGALLALGAEQEARDALRYLIATQRKDGYWYQNQWLGGHPYWTGIQLDETAFPVLLAMALAERGALGGIAVADMVRRALGFIARTGPSTPQDRWEENEGINAFTLAVAIAALAGGAEFLDKTARDWALALADFWNANVECWCAVGETALGHAHGVHTYYLRTMPAAILADRGADAAFIQLRNRPQCVAEIAADEEISTDFLQLVRMGLRPANDPVIRSTLILVDALLKGDTPAGPAWHRYVGDGYGEHDDGRPFDGTGRGRLWPLLTGERGHYELAAGGDPLPYLRAMAAMASPGGMLPEQIWDGPPIPARRLAPGRPTGSAMPLAWAHAEFAKLLLSRQLGYPIDRPRIVWQRYRDQRQAERAFWWPHAPIGSAPAGSQLVIAATRPHVVRWGTDGWRNPIEQEASATGLGFYAATLAADRLSAGSRVDFTLRWTDDGSWAGKDYRILII